MRKRNYWKFQTPVWVHRLAYRAERRFRGLKPWQRIGCMVMAGVILLATIIPVGLHIMESRRYVLSAATQQLIGKANPNLAAKITYDKSSSSWQFNKGDIPIDGGTTGQDKADMPTQNMLQARVGGASKTSQSPYAVTMPKDSDKGLTYYDSNTRLSFSMVPTFSMSDGKAVNGQLIYPAEHGMQVVYTPKSNGMKEDIVLAKPVGDDVAFSYKLELPDDLVAKVLDNGGLGIYSADPVLYGDFAFGDGQDIEKIKSARETAAKDHLLFEVPAPVIEQSGGKKPTASAKFVLDGTTLHVRATGMSDLQYPVTVDPSVTVTSSSDFGTGAADSNIDFPANEIDRGKLTGGSVGAWSSTGNGSYTVHSYGMSVIYNGYMYYVGGDSSEVPYAPINSSTSALGTWSTATSLPAARRYPGVAAYNGYMYVYGGYVSGSTAQSDVLVAQINNDGTLGTWNTAATSMATAACRSGLTVYNGYVYAVAGNYGTVASNCGNSSASHLATTQYAKMGANGKIGSWTTSASTLGTAVQSPAVAAYNGYLYSIGGTTDGATSLSTVSYAKISASTGDIGSWTSSSWTMPSTNYRQGIAAYNGYLYLVGGTNNGARTLYTQIKESGDIGKWYQTTDILSDRYSLGVAAYNGYLYYMAGTSSGSGSLNDAAYAKINPAGTLSSAASTNAFTNTRRGLEYINYGNYSYVIGGENGSTPDATVYKAAQGNNGDLQSFASTTSLPSGLAYFGAAAYKGYMYVVGGCTSVYSSCSSAGNNVATVYKATINASDGTLGSWSAQTSLSTARHGMRLVAYNDYLYAIGGLNGSTFKNDIEYHAIGASGAISGSWSASAQTFSTARAHFGAAVYGGKLYIAGGCSAGAIVTSCSSFRNDVQYADIGSTGDLSSSFTTNATSFSTARTGAALVMAYGNAYVVGGWDGTSYHSDAQMAALNTNGSLGSWSSMEAATNTRAWAGAVNVRGYLQVAGGYNGAYLNTVHYSYMNNGGAHRVLSWSNTAGSVTGWAGGGGAMYKGYLYQAGGSVSGTATANVKFTHLNSDGTTDSWSSASTMNVARDIPAVYTVGGYLYVTGGANASSTLQSSTEYAQIASDGSLGSWTTATASLPTGRVGGAYTQYGNFLYYIGGKDNGSDLSTVYYADASNGNITSWSSADALPLGASVYRASAVAYNGYMYVIGGGISDGSLYSSQVYRAAINTSSGSLTNWTKVSDMPISGYVSAVGYNGIMYVTGSYSGSYSTATYMTAINSNGSLGNWERTPNQSSVNNISGKSFGYQGYLYHLATNGVVTYGVIDTVARVGNYSKIVGLGGGYALANISYSGDVPGGKYNINYRTADVDGAFGSLHSSTALSGDPGLCATQDVAYVLVLVRLDDSGSAVFPDTYSTSASVTDLSVGYGLARAAPDTRLAHGKYFSSDTLQGLDTCGA